MKKTLLILLVLASAHEASARGPRGGTPVQIVTVPAAPVQATPVQAAAPVVTPAAVVTAPAPVAAPTTPPQTNQSNDDDLAENDDDQDDDNEKRGQKPTYNKLLNFWKKNKKPSVKEAMTYWEENVKPTYAEMFEFWKKEREKRQKENRLLREQGMKYRDMKAMMSMNPIGMPGAYGQQGVWGAPQNMNQATMNQLNMAPQNTGMPGQPLSNTSPAAAQQPSQQATGSSVEAWVWIPGTADAPGYYQNEPLGIAFEPESGQTITLTDGSPAQTPLFDAQTGTFKDATTGQTYTPAREGIPTQAAPQGMSGLGKVAVGTGLAAGGIYALNKAGIKPAQSIVAKAGNIFTGLKSNASKMASSAKSWLKKLF